uniref:Uncharacterized protein n=1 Tax=Anguilla anguilla TaxID=7936 RepID=A0A0E9U7F6_ANGAN
MTSLGTVEAKCSFAARGSIEPFAENVWKRPHTVYISQLF